MLESNGRLHHPHPKAAASLLVEQAVQFDENVRQTSEFPVNPRSPGHESSILTKGSAHCAAVPQKCTTG